VDDDPPTTQGGTASPPSVPVLGRNPARSARHRSFSRTVIIVSLGLALLCPMAASAVSFQFTLAQSIKTSAGVFSSDGTLVKNALERCLLCRRPACQRLGRHGRRWSSRARRQYQVRVLHLALHLQLGGVVGNTSTAKSGPTVFNPMNTMSGMAITGTNAYVAFGYNEQNPSPARFDTGAIGAKTYLLGAGPMFLKVATDGTNVYWAAVPARTRTASS